MSSTSAKKAIAKRLRFAREQAGLTQSQAAKILNLSRPAISEAEAGRRNVSATEVVQLARLYDVSASWLSCAEDTEMEDAKIQYAARQLERFDPEDVEKLLKLLATMKIRGEDQ